VRSAVKTRIARVRRALTEGGDNTADLGVGAIAGLDRAAAKGVLHPNNAARRKSRLMKALNAAGKSEKAEAPAKGSGKATSGKARAAATAKRSTAKKAASPARKTSGKK
jgi:small subunit ribosomal protein S20